MRGRPEHFANPQFKRGDGRREHVDAFGLADVADRPDERQDLPGDVLEHDADCAEWRLQCLERGWCLAREHVQQSVDRRQEDATDLGLKVREPGLHALLRPGEVRRGVREVPL